MRPEWKDTILPLFVKNKTEDQYRHTDCFLFGTTTWYHVTYQEGTFHFNQAKPKPKRFRSHDLLFATVPPHWNARYAILKLPQPAQLAKGIEDAVQRSMSVVNGQWSSDGCRDVGLGQPLSYSTLEWNVASKLTELYQEVEEWKDRFFFYCQFHVSYDDLCKECKEAMREAFYETPDKALAWRPGQACETKNCELFAPYANGDSRFHR